MCDVCGNSEGGWDCVLADVDMVECENGHTMDVSCCTVDSNGHNVEDYLNGDTEHEDPDRYDVPAQYCPICSFEMISSHDLERFVYKEIIQREKLIEMIKSKFGNYKDFSSYLRGKK